MKLCKESLISSISAFASRFPALCINSIVKGDDPNVSIPESYAVNTLLWRDFLSLKFSLRSCLLLSYKNHHPKLDTQHRTPNTVLVEMYTYSDYAVNSLTELCSKQKKCEKRRRKCELLTPYSIKFNLLGITSTVSFKNIRFWNVWHSKAH